MLTNGLHVASIDYSVPTEAGNVFQYGILQNALITQDLPAEALAYASRVRYVGSSKPSLPINWRFAESAAALKGLEAVLIGALLTRKYDVDVGDMIINTDHAQHAFMPALFSKIDPTGKEPIQALSTPCRQVLPQLRPAQNEQ